MKKTGITIALICLTTAAFGQGKFYGGDGDGHDCYESSIIVAVERPEKAAEVLLFPQPAADYLEVRVRNPHAGWMEVYDLHGRVLLHRRIDGQDRLRLDIKGWPGGVYLFRLTGEGPAILRKFVVTGAG